ncbi:MAG: GatB/YqeY domain-containing protein [Candidatus Magasanikbacteria bacterium]|jgi:uncharacterized protein YqeY|nr:GatB/YqeY domain-containing protein [Candidatus Magasanikbacteria bacterium]
MSLRQEIFSARDNAMRAKDTATLSTLRVLCSEIKNAEIEEQKELSDEHVQQVIARVVKQLKDAIKDFSTGGREDLVEKNMAEIAVLEAYLPAQLSDEEIIAHIQAVLAETPGPHDVGPIMGSVMKRVAGKADGTRVRTLVQQHVQA